MAAEKLRYGCLASVLSNQSDCSGVHSVYLVLNAAESMYLYKESNSKMKPLIYGSSVLQHHCLLTKQVE